MLGHDEFIYVVADTGAALLAIAVVAFAWIARSFRETPALEVSEAPLAVRPAGTTGD